MPDPFMRGITPRGPAEKMMLAMSPETFSKLKEIFSGLQDISKTFQRLWIQDILFTWQWWLLLAMTVLPWVFWIFYHKKDSANRLLFAGFFVIIVSHFLDAVGSTYGLWSYTARLIPLMPPYLPWDTSLLPVVVMTMIQFRPKISPYIKAAVFAALSSFVMEPLAIWLNLYWPTHWKHIYSFPIFFAIYLAADWLSRRKRFEHIEKQGVV